MYVVTCGFENNFSLAIWGPSEWRQCFFGTYDLAFEYAKCFVGPALARLEGKNILNNPVDYSGYGDMIQIEQI